MPSPARQQGAAPWTPPALMVAGTSGAAAGPRQQGGPPWTSPAPHGLGDCVFCGRPPWSRGPRVLRLAPVVAGSALDAAGPDGPGTAYAAAGPESREERLCRGRPRWSPGPRAPRPAPRAGRSALDAAGPDVSCTAQNAQFDPRLLYRWRRAPSRPDRYRVRGLGCLKGKPLCGPAALDPAFAPGRAGPLWPGRGTLLGGLAGTKCP